MIVYAKGQEWDVVAIEDDEVVLSSGQRIACRAETLALVKEQFEKPKKTQRRGKGKK